MRIHLGGIKSLKMNSTVTGGGDSGEVNGNNDDKRTKEERQADELRGAIRLAGAWLQPEVEPIPPEVMERLQERLRKRLETEEKTAE